MQSSNSVRPRPILVLAGRASLLLLALAACGEDGANIGPPPTSLPSRPPPSVAVPDVVMEPLGTDLPAIDVGGRVVDDLEQPIVGRPVVVVDRRGKRFEMLTDKGGRFHAAGVADPYDLLVTRASSGAASIPLVYFGLHRTDPHLEVLERIGPTEHGSQALRVGVKLPSCRKAGGACWVSVVSASVSGGGATAGSYTDGGQTAVYNFTHAFRTASPQAGETIDVHVLVGDAQYTHYAYAHVLNVPTHPAAPTDLGMTMPVAVESGDPVTISGRAILLAEQWQWTVSSQLELPGGAVIALRYDCSPSTTMRLPRLPGAAWSVGVWAQRPSVEERPYFHRALQAWSGILPLTVTQVAMDLPLPPEPVRPSLEGTLSRRGLGIAWSSGAPGLATVALTDLARGQRFRAFTANSELSQRRLEALGLARLDPGDHVLDLTTIPGATIDELTQPDAQLRQQRFGHQVPGTTTDQRFRFQVTP